MLFACIFVPCFAVQAALRAEPEAVRRAWNRRPVAVFDGPESLPRIYACNPQAGSEGIEIGATKAQAAQCPGMVLRKRMVQQELAGQDALIDCGLGFSPRVEATAAGVVVLDISGTERIFGPPQKLLRTLADHAARVGFEVHAAAAANPDTALLAARGFSGATVVAMGKERDCLARLPVEVLGLSAEQADIFESWGIRRCGELAALPSVALAERMGQAGLHLQRLARGEIRRALAPVEPPQKFEESLEIEDPVDNLEALGFILNRLLEQVSARLAMRSLATDELRLRLQLDVHEDREVGKEVRVKIADSWARTLKLPVAMEDTRVLLKLLQLDLAQHSPGSAVKGATLEARPARRRYTQAGLFAALAPEPEKLEVTLARIRGVVGKADARGRERVGSPEPLNTHQPDDFRVEHFTAAEDKRSAPSERSATVTMSVFRPPLPARVRCHGNTPIHISFGEIAAAVLCAAGPWMTSGNWWKREEQWRGEEWDIAVQTAGGMGLYRIFRDLRQNAWFVEGLYD
jgi:protein ImuB